MVRQLTLGAGVRITHLHQRGIYHIMDVTEMTRSNMRLMHFDESTTPTHQDQHTTSTHSMHFQHKRARRQLQHVLLLPANIYKITSHEALHQWQVGTIAHPRIPHCVSVLSYF